MKEEFNDYNKILVMI